MEVGSIRTTRVNWSNRIRLIQAAAAAAAMLAHRSRQRSAAFSLPSLDLQLGEPAVHGKAISNTTRQLPTEGCLPVCRHCR
jgi:hypothetical protein